MGEDNRLVVLHIASLTDDKAKGPNNNVPKNITYGNKYANVGLYNLRSGELAFKIPQDKYFTLKKYGNINNLPAPFNKPNIVVFHGIYFIQYCRIAKWLKKNRIPYIIVPRCSMTTAAIKSHELKKRVANIIFFNKFIKNAEKIQFLTENEYEESKPNFKFKNYYILGNGVEMPAIEYKPKKRNEFKIVFVGRYNVYHKGLDILLDAVSGHKEWFRENKVSLLLYGSDSDNGLKYLKKRIADEYLEESVRICGSVFGVEKEMALLDADIFIHTSRLEGQPTSVIEAISYGVPVVVTPGTNVTDIVEQYRLGFVAALDAENIFNTIKTAFDSRGQYQLISNNEIEYSRKNLGWDSIIKSSMGHYAQIFYNGIGIKD